jgi:GNAT superfamily N-acetyltransferase
MKHLKLFEKFNEPKIESIRPDDITEVLHLVSTIFSELTEMSYKGCHEYAKAATDWDKSVKLVLNGKIIGCYIIAVDKKLQNYPDKNGIEAIGLCILQEYRGKGYGELLKDWLEKYAKDNNYDFIFAEHLKSLNNLQAWLKRHELYNEDEDSYYTIKWIKKPLN